VAVAVLASSDDHPLPTTLAVEILDRLSPSEPVRPHRSQEAPAPPVAADGRTAEYVRPGGEVIHVPLGEDPALTEDTGSLELDGEVFTLVGRDGAAGHDYLVRVADGVAHYRNAPVDAPGGAEEAFAIDYLGTHVTTLVLRRGSGWATLSASGYFTFPPLSLSLLGPDLWADAVGEVLDLAATPATYANIPLRRLDPDRVEERAGH
jgi:hypothetical protein